MPDKDSNMEPETWLVKPWILDFGKTMLLLMTISTVCQELYEAPLPVISVNIHNRAICLLPAPPRSQARRQAKNSHSISPGSHSLQSNFTWCLHLLSALRACGSAQGHSVCGSAQFQTPELAASRRIWPQSLLPSLFQRAWGKV